MRKKSKASIYVIILILVMIIVFLSTRYKKYNVEITTNTYSSEFSSAKERISFFKNYVVCPTNMIDVAFYIDYQDHSKETVPKMSEWKIISIIKVKSDDVATWIEGMEQTDSDQIDLNWWKEIEINDLRTNTEPQYYVADSVEGSASYLVVYPDEGIIKQYFYRKNTE